MDSHGAHERNSKGETLCYNQRLTNEETTVRNEIFTHTSTTILAKFLFKNYQHKWNIDFGLTNKASQISKCKEAYKVIASKDIWRLNSTEKSRANS